MKRSSAQHRKDIAELKRQVRDLTKQVDYLNRQERKRVAEPGDAAEPGGAAATRFSPAWVRNHREKLEMSAADYADLVGVSGLTIYNWEKGKTKPQAKQLAAWGAVRGLGKREAWKRLEMMDA